MCSVANVLCQLGTHRRGARTLEQSVVAYRNALGERTPDRHPFAWVVTQNNLAAAMQALGVHEEDIAALEASIPLYDAVLKVVTREALPLVWALVTANRASALAALAGESDHLDAAESAVAEYDRLVELFDGTAYAGMRAAASDGSRAARDLADSLQV